jgi:tyrosyl-tRNA synthetase
MATTATADERYTLITRGIEEILGGATIKAILDEGKTPKCYWGVYTVYHSII